MKVIIRQGDYTSSSYDLVHCGDALRLMSDDGTAAIPFDSIKDFCITEDKRRSICFVLTCTDAIYEGQILDPQQIEKFSEKLKAKLNGTISIQNPADHGQNRCRSCSHRFQYSVL